MAVQLSGSIKIGSPSLTVGFPGWRTFCSRCIRSTGIRGTSLIGIWGQCEHMCLMTKSVTNEGGNKGEGSGSETEAEAEAETEAETNSEDSNSGNTGIGRSNTGSKSNGVDTKIFKTPG